jgi:hypothetical protein
MRRGMDFAIGCLRAGSWSIGIERKNDGQRQRRERQEKGLNREAAEAKHSERREEEDETN